MRKYIFLEELPDRLHHLNRGDEVDFKIKYSEFNLNLLHYFGVDTPGFEVDSTISDDSICLELPDYLLQIQKNTIKNILARDRYFVCLSPGFGKTNIVVEATKFFPSDEDIVIIAPKALHPVWWERFKRLNVPINNVRVLNIESLQAFFCLSKSKDKLERLQKMSHESFETFFTRRTHLFYDESGVIVDKYSFRFQFLKKLTDCKNIVKLVFLTGSPYHNSISDMWSQLNLLYKNDFSSFWDFAKIFCNIEIDRYGWKIKSDKSDSAKLLQYSLEKYCVFARLEDYKDMPNYTEEVIEIPLSDAQTKVYRDLEKSFLYKGVGEGEGEGVGEEVKAENTLDCLIKLKKLTLDPRLISLTMPSEKLKVLAELLEFVPRPCVVFGSLNSVLKNLASEHKGLYFSSQGEKSPDAYISGEYDLMFAQIKSGKFGFSFTQTKSVIFLDYNYDADDLFQALSRVKRLDSTLDVTIYYLVGSKIDRIMLEMNKARISGLNNLLKLYEKEKNGN